MEKEPARCPSQTTGEG